MEEKNTRKQKDLFVELKLDTRHLKLDGGWDAIIESTFKRIEQLEKEYGYSRTQLQIKINNK